MKEKAGSPLPGVRGLVFLGFPLHPPGQPSDERAKHLFEVQIPMLFLQGTRDAFARADLLDALMARLGATAELHRVEHADHSFGVLKRSGRSPTDVLEEVRSTLLGWLECRGPLLLGQPACHLLHFGMIKSFILDTRGHISDHRNARHAHP